MMALMISLTVLQNKTKRGLWIHINERKNCPGMIYGKIPNKHICAI